MPLPPEALANLRRAAERGDGTAMHNLAHFYHDHSDFEAAEHWFRRAAAAGHTRSMNNLAVLLDQFGELDEAESWYRRAAG